MFTFRRIEQSSFLWFPRFVNSFWVINQREGINGDDFFHATSLFETLRNEIRLEKLNLRSNLLRLFVHCQLQRWSMFGNSTFSGKSNHFWDPLPNQCGLFLPPHTPTPHPPRYPLPQPSETLNAWKRFVFSSLPTTLSPTYPLKPRKPSYTFPRTSNSRNPNLAS